jgi:hypothetical protein
MGTALGNIWARDHRPTAVIRLIKNKYYILLGKVLECQAASIEVFAQRVGFVMLSSRQLQNVL